MKTVNERLLRAALMVVSMFGIYQQTMAAEAGGMPMDHGNMPMQESAANVVHGMGVVKEINAEASTVTLAHEAIPELNWPAMVMSFKVAGEAGTVSVGQKVKFELTGEGTDVTIIKIEPVE